MKFFSDLQEVCDQSAVHRTLGLEVRSSEGGTVLVTQLGSSWTNDGEGDTIHGGVASLLLDTAATLALIGATGDDWTTVDLRVDFLVPLTEGPIEARGTVLHAGRTLGRAQASVLNSGEQPCAIATGTFRRGRRLLANVASD